MAGNVEEGILVGLLVGGGHFGGDGRQPQVTLRMHERHETLFRWLERAFPGARVYGPYEHGGRRYYQWMGRGQFLREELVPMLRRSLSPTLDRYAHGRFLTMCERYAPQLGLPGEGTPDTPDAELTEGSGAPPAGEPRADGPDGAAGSRATSIFAALRETVDAPHVRN